MARIDAMHAGDYGRKRSSNRARCGCRRKRIHELYCEQAFSVTTMAGRCQMCNLYELAVSNGFITSTGLHHDNGRNEFSLID